MAISELGSWDAPFLWYWNILGYIVPGLVITFLGVSLKVEHRVSGWNSFPYVALTLSGLFLVLSGVLPADMDNRLSTTTVIHYVGSLGSGVAFIIAAFWLPSRFKETNNWQWLSAPILILAWGLVLCMPIRSTEYPGLGQRISFGIYLTSIALVGCGLYRSAGKNVDA